MMKDEYIFPYLYLGTKSYKNKKSKIANKNINSKMFLEVKKLNKLFKFQ